MFTVLQHDVNSNALQQFLMTYQILCNMEHQRIPVNPQTAFRNVNGLSVSNDWTWRIVNGGLNTETEATL